MRDISGLAPGAMRRERTDERKPWIAGVANFLAPPVGYLYAGRARRGVIVYVAALLLGLAIVEASTMAHSRAVRLGLFLLFPLLAIGPAVDAARAAARNRSGPRKPYQVWWVYVGVALVVAFALQPALTSAARGRWRAFTVSSPAMEPTLLEGDYVFARRGAPVRRGMVATRVDSTGTVYLSRVAAVAGDTVRMRGGELAVNGAPSTPRFPIPADERFGAGDDQFAWQRPYLAGDTVAYRPTAATWGPLVVPRDSVMMLGDNRGLSYDSRHLGWIAEDRVTGRVEWIYLSRHPESGRWRWDRVGRSVR